MTDRDLLRQFALAQLNIPYIWGGNNPYQGFDCSGLVLYLLRAFKAVPSRDMTSQGLYNYLGIRGRGKPVGVFEFGAVVFYGNTAESITHCGLCLSPTIMIEAAGGSSKIKTASQALKAGAAVKLSLVRQSKLVGIVMPNYPWVK